jgi:hypothetical protein
MTMVTIYRFLVHTVDEEPQISLRWGTRAAIGTVAGATLIEETGCQLDSNDSAFEFPGLTGVGYWPTDLPAGVAV